MEHEDDIMAIVKRVKMQLTEFYNGNSWVTENFKEKILSLKEEDAAKMSNGHNHSVAQLTGHIAAWRNFVLQKLNGNDSYDIEDNSTIDWPGVPDWKTICRQFEVCHTDLIKAIESFPIDRWDSTVPGRKYSFLYLINGVVEHDYYHYGQIGSLLAAIKKDKKS